MKKNSAETAVYSGMLNRGSQTVYSAFINHQLPRHENTAVLDGEKKPNKRSDSRGGCTPFCGALIENRM